MKQIQDTMVLLALFFRFKQTIMHIGQHTIL